MSRMNKTETSDTMDDMAQQAKATYQQVKSSAMDTGKAAMTDIKARAADMADTMKDGLEARADVAKDSLAEGGKRLAETIRNAGGDPGSMQAKVLDLVATNVAELSEQMQGRDLRSIMDDVQGFARRNPALFVAGAAAAGFAMARFLRSSAEPEIHEGEIDVQSPTMYAPAVHGMTDEPYSELPLGNVGTGHMEADTMGPDGSMTGTSGIGQTMDDDARLRDGSGGTGTGGMLR